MPTFNFTDNDGIDIGNKYVTKDYVMDIYPNLIPAIASPNLWTWGSNARGQLGTGDTTGRSSPGTTAGSSATWIQFSCGGTGYVALAPYEQSCGIKSDGTAWVWGYNVGGSLGDGTTTNRSSPVTTAGGGTNWKQIMIGQQHGSGVKTDGTLWTWGQNAYGNLGTGDTTSRSSPGTTAGGGTTWKQIAVGNYYMAAIKTDGTLWTWGYNLGGKLGTGDATNYRSSPGTTAGGGTNWKQASVNKEGNNVAAIKTDGTLWTWGSNGSGELGTGNTTSRSSPGTTAGGGTNWKQVSVGWGGMSAIKTDGTLWTWGSNYQGQLGDGTTTSRSSPGTTAGGGTDWRYTEQGYYSTVAIKTDGTLWTCGYNSQGQLGDNSTNPRSSPGTIAGSGTNWKTVSMASGYAGAIAEQGNW